ncbi:DUF4073 domain-containing protein [Bacillus sp. DX1.1]|uniref:DUF4073 domain-containing protein n=1 Tax=unclassified Bacillus (in: firmicutes) TaxID=185979 RepID=UPI002570F78A|nr:MULTISPECIES: DUF4073 domain-containing protein [unclassified Bacillus (in: firmicutes)]MDM5155393.1 DUF4073 domain-containing protein [Bacillus sp. DX1.1]WJE79708.1 DUF4073 domain-containing protein [Bacillus sp. DX3.1]
MKKAALSIATIATLLPVFSTGAQAEEHVREQKSATMFNVSSDIQGDLGDFDHILKDMNKVTPHSRALIMNGDITGIGLQSQYDGVKRVLNENKHPQNIWSTVGNHEFYAPKWTADGTLAQMAPDVIADDKKNVIVGATEYMEYSIEGTNEWHTYNPANLPKFEGDQTVYVRHKGEMNLQPGLTQIVRFSADK